MHTLDACGLTYDDLDACVWARARVHMCKHTRTHTCMRTLYARTRMHAHMHTRTRTKHEAARSYLANTYTRACTPLCMRPQVLEGASVTRVYWAVVASDSLPQGREGRMRAPILVEGRRLAALTYYRVRRASRGLAWVELMPQTGACVRACVYACFAHWVLRVLVCWRLMTGRVVGAGRA